MDEFSNINDRIPDLESALKARIMGKSFDLPPPGTVDPYQLMLRKRRQMDSNDIDPGNIVRWPEEDVKMLQDYCMKMGVYGFNTTIHPRLALAQLKQQFGDYSQVPLDERIPDGYEKLGTKHSYHSNHSYSEEMKRKLLLD